MTLSEEQERFEWAATTIENCTMVKTGDLPLNAEGLLWEGKAQRDLGWRYASAMSSIPKGR
jgi:hypothetical protein